MRHLIDPMDLTVEEIDQLLAVGDDIIQNPAKYSEICKGKKLATLFYEPSTRTRLSFESAMLELGGSVIGFSSADSSSAAKGESVADTIRVIGCFADIAAMRHPKEGAPMVAAMNSPIPVINAGDGGHQHPTQTLTDLMTIHRLKGHLDNLTIGLCGDLKFGRTVHSLILALSRYTGIRFVLISPKELAVPDYIKEEVLDKKKIPYTEVQSLDEAMPELDILYMTRIQRERFASEEEYLRLKDSYILTPKQLELAKPDMYILHPLPRVNEISVAVDNDPRAAYFTQVFCGKIIRMALILKLLDRIPAPFDQQLPAPERHQPQVVHNHLHCGNPRCITTIEQELPQAFRPVEEKPGAFRCIYCWWTNPQSNRSFFPLRSSSWARRGFFIPFR